MTTRVLVIGLDGATFDVIDPLMAAGRLPNLAHLRAEGMATTLLSTYPTHSGPAWTSCRTGVNPGKHGVFSFWRREGYEFPLTTSADIRVPTVEQILSRRGRRVCSINVPVSYPPQPVNGALISGLPTPGEDVTFTYPASLHAELRARVGEYRVDGHGQFAGLGREERIELIFERHRLRRAAAHYLLAREPWDYFMVVFTMSDKVQHQCWHAYEARQAGDTSARTLRLAALLERCYEELDEAVGLLLAEAGDDADVLVMSDHGFGACRYQINPNMWLRDHGYLHLYRAHKLRARQICWTARDGGRVPLPRIEVGPPRRRIAWRRTRAFGSLYTLSHGIWLNMQGRDIQGVVAPGREAERLAQELADGLLTLTLPDGTPVFRAVERAEEYYPGAYATAIGDLVPLPFDPSVRLMGQFTTGSAIEDLASQPSGRGNHRPEGILLARGPHICAGQAPDDAGIVDVTPSALMLLGEPVPEYMDGRALFA